MLILATGTLAGSRKLLAQVRDAVTTYERPAAYIDAAGGWQADPVAALRTELGSTVEQVSPLLDELWDSGIRTFVIALPDVAPDKRPAQLAEAAFRLRRQARQPVYHLNGDDAMHHQHGGTWTPESFESVLRSTVKNMEKGPQVRPAEPAPPRYETPRLILTWPTPEQIDGYYHAIIGTDIFNTIIWNGPSSPDDLHDYWLRCRQDYVKGADQQLSFAAIEKSSGEVVGGLSLRPHNVPFGVWDVGYALAKKFHGRGYATEAAGVLVDIAFGERGAERVFANAFVGNDASRRVLEKLGFQLEGVSRSFVAKPFGRVDEWLLAITRPEWKARRAGR